jgi:hypothetical protein
MCQLRGALNQGILPPGFYAMSERPAGDLGESLLKAPPDAFPSDAEREWENMDALRLVVVIHAHPGDARIATVDLPWPTLKAEPLEDIPLLLDERHTVSLPLEQTYLAAYEGVPRRWKPVIERAD